MGRTAKIKRQPAQTEATSSRDVPDASRKPDQMQAASMTQPLATGINCEPAVSAVPPVADARSSAAEPASQSSTVSNYLTIKELKALNQDTNVVVDMSAMFKKKCDIYTAACVVLEGIDMYRMMLTMPKEVINLGYRDAAAHCTAADPDVLFHAMNTAGDKELKAWRLFCANCLLIATHQYLVHNKPLPVRLEGNPSLLLTTRNRARINDFWGSYLSDHEKEKNKVDLSGWTGGTVMKSGRVLMSFSTEELGLDDPVFIDMSQYMRCKTKMYMERSKEELVEQIYDIMSQCQFDIRLNYYKTMYQQLRKNCAEYDDAYVRNQTDIAVDCCFFLAVLDRLLYGKPLRIVPAHNRQWIDTIDKLNINDYDPSISSGKGGYEVHGELLEGAGETVVHLQFDDVDPSMVLYLDMSKELGVDTIIQATHEEVMRSRQKVAPDVSCKDAESVKQRAAWFHRGCTSINPHTYEHAQAGCSKAAQQWTEHEARCICLVALLSTAYKKPIRLCYGSKHGPGSHDGKEIDHVNAMRQLCLKHYDNRSA